MSWVGPLERRPDAMGCRSHGTPGHWTHTVFLGESGEPLDGPERRVTCRDWNGIVWLCGQATEEVALLAAGTGRTGTVITLLGAVVACPSQ